LSKGGGKQTVTQTVDPGTQKYLEQMRGQATNASNVALNNPSPFMLGPSALSIGDQAGRFMNPYQDQVIGGIRGEFDHLRNQAGMQSNQQATMQGAYGGNRAAIAQGARLGELDRAQASQIGSFLHGGYNDALKMGLGYSEYERSLRERQAQEPIFRQQQGLNFTNMGMGPYGSNTSQQQQGGGLFGLGFLGL
jgi:hypothetical protein